MLAQDWGKPTDLGAQCCTDMLRIVRHKVLNTAHDVVQEGFSVDERTEARNLTGNCSSNLGLIVFEKLDKRGHEISGNHLFVHSLGNLHV